MEQVLQVLVENGIPAAAFLALIYYIFWDKKQMNDKTTEERKYQQAKDDKFISILESIDKNMLITNERLSNLEKKKEDE